MNAHSYKTNCARLAFCVRACMNVRKRSAVPRSNQIAAHRWERANAPKRSARITIHKIASPIIALGYQITIYQRLWMGASKNLSRNFPRVMKPRSEEHTSELQSQSNLVCRLLL